MRRYRRRGNRRRGILALRILLLVIGLVLIGIPFLWIVLTAFKDPVAADASPPMFISPLTLSNFDALFQDGYAKSLLNSVIITTLATGFTLIFGIPAGYAFARGRFRGRNFFGAFLLFSRMVPPVIYIIPLFLFFHLLNLIGTFTGLTLAYLTGLLPFTVWMSASYFQGVPVELEDAARVDGCSRLRSFVSISLPLALPGIVSVGLLIGIAAWGEYFIPLILGGFSTEPATVGIVDFVGIDGSSWGPMAAGALCLIVPVFLATLVAQRSLIDGLTSGALKG
jgi:multiple sugar transport system permease protein